MSPRLSTLSVITLYVNGFAPIHYRFHSSVLCVLVFRNRTHMQWTFIVSMFRWNVTHPKDGFMKFEWRNGYIGKNVMTRWLLQNRCFTLLSQKHTRWCGGGGGVWFNKYINEIKCRSRFGLANRLWSCPIGSNDDAIVCVFAQTRLSVCHYCVKALINPKIQVSNGRLLLWVLPHRASYPLLSRFTLFVFGKPIVWDVCRNIIWLGPVDWFCESAPNHTQHSDDDWPELHPCYCCQIMRLSSSRGLIHGLYTAGIWPRVWEKGSCCHFTVL